MAERDYLQRVHEELADSGKLIEAGWISMRLACGLANAPADQLREMRMAFFGGAQHLYSSIMTVLEPGEEYTDKDLARIGLIDAELRTFFSEFAEMHMPTKGSA